MAVQKPKKDTRTDDEIEDALEKEAIRKAIDGIKKQGLRDIAIELQGYVIEAKGGYLIKTYKNGRVEKIERL